MKVSVRIEGADEVARALDKLPKDAQESMQAEAKDIATSLGDWIKIAGRRLGRQGPRVASTVRVGREGFWPTVSASNTGRASGLLFGFEFGMKRHTGWYNHARYNRLPGAGHQFWPHRGGSSYWFFKTKDERLPWIESEWGKAAEDVVRKWSA